MSTLYQFPEGVFEASAGGHRIQANEAGQVDLAHVPLIHIADFVELVGLRPVVIKTESGHTPHELAKMASTIAALEENAKRAATHVAAEIRMQPVISDPRPDISSYFDQHALTPPVEPIVDTPVDAEQADDETDDEDPAEDATPETQDTAAPKRRSVVPPVKGKKRG